MVLFVGEGGDTAWVANVAYSVTWGELVPQCRCRDFGRVRDVHLSPDFASACDAKVDGVTFEAVRGAKFDRFYAC